MLIAPARVVHVDADGPFHDIVDGSATNGEPYRTARVLVWRDDRPIGALDLPIAGGLAAADLAHAVRRAVARAPARSESRPARTGPRPSATVVVATRDRPESLLRCVRSILAGNGPIPDVVVVDSAPSDDAALRCLRTELGHVDASIRYVASERPGLALAHNVALPHVDTDVVLFTDADVVVDRRWVSALTDAIADTASVCATGMILPAELETGTQCLIEAGTGFHKGYARRLFDLRDHRPADALFPFTAGTMGSGANMAFRTDHLRRVGGFDACLGAGSPGVGGDDLAAFMDVVLRGERITYEPAAVVFHHHHRHPDALERQARAYGIGLTAAVSSVLAHHPRWCLGLARRVPRAVRFAVSPSSPKNGRLPDDYPARLRRRELIGMATGPIAYLRSRRTLASWRRSGDLAPPPAVTIARPHGIGR